MFHDARMAASHSLSCSRVATRQRDLRKGKSRVAVILYLDCQDIANILPDVINIIKD
jgi:hypothetical protein